MLNLYKIPLAVINLSSINMAQRFVYFMHTHLHTVEHYMLNKYLKVSYLILMLYIYFLLFVFTIHIDILWTWIYLNSGQKYCRDGGVYGSKSYIKNHTNIYTYTPQENDKFSKSFTWISIILYFYTCRVSGIRWVLGSSYNTSTRRNIYKY